MKKPTIQKEPKAPKERKSKKGDAARSDTAGSNTLDPEKRALFLADKDAYAKAKEKLGKAQSAVRLVGKTIKADGFSMRQIKLAIQLESPEGEAEFRSLIANDLLAAQYAGAKVGSQLLLFLDDKDRTPAVDRAYYEGQAASMKGETAKPSYAPETEQYRQFMAGFHDDTERRAKAGITKPEQPPASEMN